MRKFAKKHLRLFELILICSCIFIPLQITIAAELIWTDGPISVGVGDTLTISSDSSINNVSDISVLEGGTLIIQSRDFLLTNSIDNKGTIQITGRLTIDNTVTNISNTGTIIVASEIGNEHGGNFVIPNNKFEDFIQNGKLVVGYENTPDEWNKNNFTTVGLEGSPVIHNFNASQFVTEFKGAVNNEILMGSYGFLRLGTSPVNISGNELTLGKIKFADVYNMYKNFDNPEYDISSTGMSRLRSSDLTLKPENGWITLKSGILQVGKSSGAPGSTNTNYDSSLKIEEEGLKIDGGVLLLGAGGNLEGEELNITGNIEIGNNASTNIDSGMITKAGDWLLTGNLTLNKSGYLEVGQTYLSGSGKEFTSTLTIDGNFNISGSYTVDQNTLNVLKNTIGNEDTVLEVKDQGILKIVNAKINGGQINLAETVEQPTISRSFREAANIVNAPQGAIAFESNNIDARINVGKNSLLTLGSNDPQWLLDKMDEYQTKNNKTWGEDVTSVLAVRSPQTLSSAGGLNVDGNLKLVDAPAKVNQARFADKSLFVVDASGIGKNAALSGDGKNSALVVESGAQLLVTDGAGGDTVIITDKFPSATISEDGWTANASTPLLNADGELLDPANGTYVVRINNGATPQTAFPMLSSELAKVVAQLQKQRLDTDSVNPGVRFVSRAVDNRYIGANDTTLAAATIESAARIATLGAAPQMTMAANSAAGAAITQRTSFAQPNGVLMAIDNKGNHIIESQNRFERNFALWIMPLYQSVNGFGMEAGKFDYDFSGALGGVALGGDYTFEDTFRVGLAFNIGGGYAKGTGDLNKTTNNMNFWGIGAYAGWSQNNFGLTADINYTSTYNKIKQNLPGSMQMGDLKSDIRGNAISTGLRAEYKVITDYLDIVPHVGFRYTNLFFDSYNAKSDGKVLHGDKFYQNIWTFPIGMIFTKEFAMANDWHIKPLLDLNITPAAGDIKAKSKIKFNGINQKAGIETKMMDYITYGGTAGFEIGNDTVTVGVDYNGQFGSESSAHSVFGSLRVEF